MCLSVHADSCHCCVSVIFTLLRSSEPLVTHKGQLQEKQCYFTTTVHISKIICCVLNDFPWPMSHGLFCCHSREHVNPEFEYFGRYLDGDHQSLSVN